MPLKFYYELLLYCFWQYLIIILNIASFSKSLPLNFINLLMTYAVFFKQSLNLKIAATKFYYND